jgi:hypothetical protein
MELVKMIEIIEDKNKTSYKCGKLMEKSEYPFLSKINIDNFDTVEEITMVYFGKKFKMTKDIFYFGEINFLENGIPFWTKYCPLFDPNNFSIEIIHINFSPEITIEIGFSSSKHRKFINHPEYCKYVNKPNISISLDDPLSEILYKFKKGDKYIDNSKLKFPMAFDEWMGPKCVRPTGTVNFGKIKNARLRAGKDYDTLEMLFIGAILVS